MTHTDLTAIWICVVETLLVILCVYSKIITCPILLRILLRLLTHLHFLDLHPSLHFWTCRVKEKIIVGSLYVYWHQLILRLPVSLSSVIYMFNCLSVCLLFHFVCLSVCLSVDKFSSYCCYIQYILPGDS